MKLFTYSSIGIIIGVIIIVMVFVWRYLSNAKKCLMTNNESNVNGEVERKHSTPIKESIRQIALIEKDEFESFYTPVIQRVEEYEALLGAPKIDRSYFETIYKALRKRRASIFEFGSSEKDQETKALWTFALFCTLSLRYIIRRYQEYHFSIDAKSVNQFLLTLEELSMCERVRVSAVSSMRSDSLNIHLIDKVLSVRNIKGFSDAGIYPYVLNGTSGFYHERINPFYSIIEQVESHVNGQILTETELFKQNIEIILTLIQRNTFSKNTPQSLVFEGMSYLLIDRNFLWELYRGYAISEEASVGKREFEKFLVEVLDLGNQLERITNYRITLEEKIIDDNPEKAIVELRNMVALTYKAVPYYLHSDRKRIQKNTLHRDVTIGDIGGVTVEEHPIVQPVVENKSSKNTNFSKDQHRAVGLKDLFSDHQ